MKFISGHSGYVGKIMVLMLIIAIFSGQCIYAEDMTAQDASEVPEVSEALGVSEVPEVSEVLEGESDTVMNNKVSGEYTDSNGLITYNISNGEAILMSCRENISGNLVIPSSVNGVEVKAIHSSAFMYCTGLTSVMIPTTIAEIGESAFAYCTGLQSAEIAGNDVEVGRCAFYYCSGLNAVNVSGALASIGEMAFEGSALTVLPDMNGVRSIGSRAFYECDTLTAVSLPEGLTYVGDDVFHGCSGASSDVIIPESLTAENTGKNLFYGCERLSSVVLPDNWTGIPEGMFYHCKSMSPVKLPSGITVIGAFSFTGSGAAGLDDSGTLNIPSGVAEIGESAYAYGTDIITVNLPDSLNTLGKNAFYYCTQLKTIKFPKYLEKIENGTFYGCAVTHIEWPDGLVAIGSADSSDDFGAFMECRGISELEIPEGVEVVGPQCFSGCWQLEDVTLPSSLSYIGTLAFKGCKGLKSVNFKKGAAAASVDTESWGNLIFSGCNALETVNIPGSWKTIPQSMFDLCTGLDSVDIAYGVEKTGERAFYGCSALKRLKMPDSMIVIGDYAFAQCTGISEIEFSRRLTDIGANAFEKCVSLTELEFPDSLEIVGEAAFKSCSSVAEIHFPANGMTAGAEAFASCTSLKSLTVDSSVILSKGAFSGCSGLESLTMKNGFEEIPAECFASCTELKKINFSKDLKIIGIKAFDGCTSLTSVILPEGLVSIQAQAFRKTGLVSVTLPSSLDEIYSQAFAETPVKSVTVKDGISEDVFEYPVKIGSGADYNGISYGDLSYDVSVSVFYNCKNLEKINIPDSWTRIPDHFLDRCTGSLGTFTVPESIISIGEYAFFGCNGLTQLKLPDTLESIEKYALYQSGLVSLNIPDSVSQSALGKFALAGCTELKKISLPSAWTMIPDGLLWGNTSITEYEIPEGIISIGENAFQNSAIKMVQLPSTLRTIGQCAFYGTGLKSVNLPGNVAVIERMSFAQCNELTDVIIGDGVSTIDGLAFGYCEKLENVSIPNSTVNINAAAFYASNPGRLRITGSFDSYAMEFANHIAYVVSDNSSVTPGIEFSFLPFDEVSTAKNYEYGPDYRIKQNGVTYVARLISTTNRSTEGDAVGGNTADGPLWFTNYSLKQILEVESCDEYVTDINVPDELCGMPVSSVSLQWYVYNYDTGKYDSCNYDNLIAVRLGSNVQKVYLDHLSSVQSLDFGNSEVTEITAKNCTALKSLEIPSTISVLDHEAFNGCSSLSSVTFNEGIRKIMEYAFTETALTEVWLPASLQQLQPNAFDEDVIIHFTGNANNVTYSHVDDDLMVVFDQVVPVLMKKGVTIAQFYGNGLAGQHSYYSSAENVGGQVSRTASGTEAAALQLQDSESAAEAASVADASAAGPKLPDSTDAASNRESSSDNEGSDDADSAGADVSIYEVVSGALQSNPIVAGGLVIIILVLIVLGGYRRLRRAR